MASNKTEKPTAKKKRDAAKQGQTFKSRDLISTCLLLVGIEVVINFTSLKSLSDILYSVLTLQFNASAYHYILQCSLAMLAVWLPLFLLCIIAACVPGLLQTGMRLATKIFKLNFSALNPVKGLKKIFSLRNLKDLIKSCLYLSCFFIAIFVFWIKNKGIIISLSYAEPSAFFYIWGKLLHSLLMIFILFLIIIILMDCIGEYMLYIKDIKMEKKEVEREEKELNGNPQIKSKRKSLHHEILSEGVKRDIKKSNMLIVNPQHIAIGIYFNPEIIEIPFISILEKDQRAKAIRYYAEKVGIPVVENINLAREIYKTHKKHSFISLALFTEVMDILVWLGQLEKKWTPENNQLNGDETRVNKDKTCNG